MKMLRSIMVSAKQSSAYDGQYRIRLAGKTSIELWIAHFWFDLGIGFGVKSRNAFD